MDIGINLSITGTIVLNPSVPPVEEDDPYNLITNGTFSSTSPPPGLTAPGGSATLLISGGKLVFTGGTGGNLSATWAGLDVASGAAYRLVYDASDQVAGCVPRASVGGGTTVNGLGTTGEQAIDLVAGGVNTSLVISYTPTTAPRAVTLDNVRLYKRLVTLQYSGGVEENQPGGTLAMSLDSGKTLGSVLTLTNDAGGLFEMDGDNIVTTAPLDYETAGSYDVEVTETLEGAYGSPKVTPLTIPVVDVGD